MAKDTDMSAPNQPHETTHAGQGHGESHEGGHEGELHIVPPTIVVLFFMHVKYSSRLTKLTVGAGLFTFLTLIAMTLADYFTRAWGRW
jgi:hypothetical protein